MEQKRDWTLQLKRAILESYNAVIPYHARELVMQLGQDKAAGKKRQILAPRLCTSCLFPLRRYSK